MGRKSKVRGPDFLGIGSQKAGTTWLDQNLRHHPQIWMPPTKTIRYFNETSRMPLVIRALGRKREDARWRNYVKKRVIKAIRRKPDLELAWNLRYILRPRTDRWDLSLFRPGPNQVGGEITPAYCRMPLEVVQRMRRLVPDTKIIYVIRNPIDRLWSHAAMRFSKLGRKLKLVPEEEMLKFFESDSASAYSNVVQCLDVWESTYPAEQLFIGFFEQLETDPAVFLKDIYRFLEVDSSDDFVPEAVREKRNRGKYRPIPETIMRMLAPKYHDQIRTLHQRFDNEYTANWLERVEEHLD